MQVLVIGLAVTGESLVRYFSARGDHVTVVEDAPSLTPDYATRCDAARIAGALLVESPSPDELQALLDGIDLVVPSPGVPERHGALTAARRAGVTVRSEVDLAGEIAQREGARPKIAAVTGTNGKTTVTTLAALILEAAGVAVTAAGNIGRPLLDAVRDDVDVVVAEVSSFQLAFADSFRPQVAALLNLGADHLDWHRTFDAYAQAKRNVFARQGPDDLLVFNADDPVVAGLAAGAPGRRIPFSVTAGAATGYRVAETANGALLVAPDGRELVAVEELELRAPHDLANALAAAAIALELGADDRAVRTTLVGFGGLAHRAGVVAEHNGVRFVDDSKATNPHATIAAVRARDGVVLIAGGRNKGLDLGELRVLAPRLRGVVAIGEAAPEIVDVFEGAVTVTSAASMRDAVRAAAGLARAGDTVLLSPACASFDAYPSYAARGDDFAREVRDLVEVDG